MPGDNVQINVKLIAPIAEWKKALRLRFVKVAVRSAPASLQKFIA
jgi:translation elongation factor EF-Tu-like GTPase